MVDILTVYPRGFQDLLAITEVTLSGPTGGGVTLVLHHGEPKGWTLYVVAGIAYHDARD